MDMIRSVIVAVLLIGSNVCGDQEVVDYLADNLKVTFQVITNPETDAELIYKGIMKLNNTGSKDIDNKDWEIFFCCIRIMFPKIITPENQDAVVEFGDTKITVSHINGCLYRLRPLEDFQGFEQNAEIELPFEASDWSVSRTDIMPRWYVVAPGAEPKIIASTASEALDFASPFDTPAKWKRLVQQDLFNPLKAEERFSSNTANDNGGPVKHVIPTPVNLECDDSVSVNVGTGDWVVFYTDPELTSEAEYLAEKWNTRAVNTSDAPSNRYVQLSIGDPGNNNAEAYSLLVMADISVINITASTNTGAFYGVQSLLSLYDYSTNIPQCNITDYPRFPFRGMHLDVGRNFVEKENVLKLLDVMAMYKLNKFHFHLTEDEGWRLEIPFFPDLTGIGARRCYDGLEERQCLLSQLGSGPGTDNSGTGFYSVQDYQDILRYATRYHIEVIPEFDMPGHGRAAIKAMEKRYDDLKDTDMNGAMEYLLSDLNDTSQYFTAQIYTDNSVNPCIESTYNFVKKLVEEVKAIHEDVQPLKIFHFGGDEVAEGAWLNSSACIEMIENNPDFDYGPNTNDQLHRYFAVRVAEIVNESGLDLAGWEDGLSYAESPINRTEIPNPNVYVNTWENTWEWEQGDNAYIFANADYKVIISHATHFYFDHPQEADPEERGYYWATRVSDIKKGFSYYADDVYENIDIDRMGNPLDREEFCSDNISLCTPLEESKRPNVLGLQGHLWSETVRTPQQLASQIFPRMISMAERAWHKAEWEDTTAHSKSVRDDMREEDWTHFANTLGYKELKRLDEMGIEYYIPPPGARIKEGTSTLEVNNMLPGLPIEYSLEGESLWTPIRGSVDVVANVNFFIHTRSSDRKRASREVQVLAIPEQQEEGEGLHWAEITLIVLAVVAVIVVIAVLAIRYRKLNSRDSDLEMY